jgi:hypothetical protein
LTLILAVAVAIGFVAGIWLRVYSLLLIIPAYLIASVIYLVYLDYGLAAIGAIAVLSVCAVQAGYALGGFVVLRTKNDCRERDKLDCL